LPAALQMLLVPWIVQSSVSIEYTSCPLSADFLRTLWRPDSISVVRSQ
jgi:hypothetical protein